MHSVIEYTESLSAVARASESLDAPTALARLVRERY